MIRMKDGVKIVRREPDLEQWHKLYEVAAALQELAPWRVLWDADIVTIQLPERAEPVFCSVMGRGGNCCGIVVYPDQEAYERLHRLLAAEDDVSSRIEAGEQRCLTCYYGDREEIQPQDRRVIQELGLTFRGRGRWIYFRAMEPGYFPDFLDAVQATVLIGALQNLYMACGYLLQGEIKVDFEAGETLLRFYSEERGEWLNAAVPMPAFPQQRPIIRLTDELLAARLKKQKMQDFRLELDSFFIPAPIQESRDKRPYLPRLTILADRDKGQVLAQHLAPPEE